ncbi:hypothetical protein RM190_08435 [Paracoccus sp. CPCC 101403]|uniref:Uncharacterized protein n=2 Tax=Paracoccus TaxID=265 RepID=A0ABU3EEN2_9RHOB|nr:hypothetical protein [Paracoccus sp. CPCC 101403]MDT1061880.1 hypothetical protein [Paracoccus sp. CPCC 101403]
MDDHYPHIRTFQSQVKRPEDRMSGVASVICVIAGTFLAIGLFIGWLVFAPQAMAAPACGSVEACMVQAEGGGL